MTPPRRAPISLYHWPYRQRAWPYVVALAATWIAAFCAVVLLVVKVVFG
jgi:hypothetical protein